MERSNARDLPGRIDGVEQADELMASGLTGGAHDRVVGQLQQAAARVAGRFLPGRMLVEGDGDAENRRRREIDRARRVRAADIKSRSMIPNRANRNRPLLSQSGAPFAVNRGKKKGARQRSVFLPRFL